MLDTGRSSVYAVFPFKRRTSPDATAPSPATEIVFVVPSYIVRVDVCNFEAALADVPDVASVTLCTVFAATLEICVSTSSVAAYKAVFAVFAWPIFLSSADRFAPAVAVFAM